MADHPPGDDRDDPDPIGDDDGRDDAPIAMRIDGVVVDPKTQTPVVILRGVLEPRLYLPVFIGGLEATAIATVLAGVTLPRPMTHDLMTTLLEAVQCRVSEVLITRLEAQTFYAQITIADGQGGRLELDARPSDALALALRADAPIAVARAVLAEAGGFADEPAPSAEGVHAPRSSELAPDPETETETDPETAVDPKSAAAPDSDPGSAPAPSPRTPAPEAPPAPSGPQPVGPAARLEDLDPEVFGKYKM